EERAFESARWAAGAGADDMCDLIDGARATGKIVERLPAFWNGEDSDRDQLLAALAAPHPAFMGLLFVTPDFQEHGAASGMPPNGRLNMSDRDHVRQAVSTGRLSVTSRAIQSRISNATIL